MTRHFTNMKYLHLVILPFFIFSGSGIAQSWDELAYLGKKYREDGDLAKAIEFLSRAAEQKPSDKYELYLYAGILSARIDKSDDAFTLLNKSVISGMWDISRLERNTRLNKLKSDERWRALIKNIMKEESKYIKSSNLTHPEIRNELKKMWAKDQDFVGKKEQLDVIKYNSSKLKQIIQNFGWPTKHQVGKDGEWIAWAIAQHSHDIVFQRECLARLRELTFAREISPVYYAELTDRVARNSGSPQVYGMAIVRIDGKKVFYPIVDPENIDTRRTRIGLPPLEVWANENFVDINSLANKQSQRGSLNSSPLP